MTTSTKSLERTTYRIDLTPYPFPSSSDVLGAYLAEVTKTFRLEELRCSVGQVVGYASVSDDVPPSRLEAMAERCRNETYELVLARAASENNYRRAVLDLSDWLAKNRPGDVGDPNAVRVALRLLQKFSGQ